MNYKKYQHIEKLGSSEVEGILNGTCYISYKIDGTNACVFLKEDGKTLGFGSRNRELSLENDNANFANSITNNKTLYNSLQAYLQTFPTRIIYGEWLVPVTIKRYVPSAQKKFYVFDVLDNETGRYISYDEYTKDFEILGIDYIPIIAKLENPTVEQIEGLLSKTGDFLLDNGLGEGLVIHNYDFVNKYGRTVWAKLLTEDYRESKQKTRQVNHENKAEHAMEYKIISLMTSEHIHKEYNKLIENKGSWESKYISELLERVFKEFIRDNWEIILKKFRYPVIDFKVLRKLSNNLVKETLSL